MTTTPDRSAPPQRGSQPFQAHRRPECAGRACRDDADDERAGHARPEDADDELLGAEPEGAIIFLISASCPSNIWTFSARSSSEGLPAALPTGDRLRPEPLAASLFASHNSFLLSHQNLHLLLLTVDSQTRPHLRDLDGPFQVFSCCHISTNNTC